MEKTGQEYPSQYHRAICWTAVSLLALLFIALFVVMVIWGMGALFVWLEPVLLPVVVAAALAYILYPLVRLMRKRTGNRLLSVLSVMFISLSGLVALGWAIIPPIVKSTGELFADRHRIASGVMSTCTDVLNNNSMVQQGVDMLYRKVLTAEEAENGKTKKTEETAEPSYPEKMAAVLDYNSAYLVSKGLSWLTAGSRAISGMGFFVVGVIMVPVFLFYFLLEGDAIKKNWHDVLPIRRSEFRTELVETLEEINGYIVAFVRGQMLVSLIDAVLLAIGLKIIGLPYALSIAGAAALLGIIPYLGMISCCVPALFVAWFTWGDVTMTVVVAGIFVMVSQFDSWIIQPRVVGNRVGMHDLTVMFSVLFWSVVLGGIVGCLLAVPLTAAIKVVFTRYIWSSMREDMRREEAEVPTPGAPTTLPTPAAKP